MGVLVDQVTAAVREHVTLEREVTNYWLAKYFEQELARDPDKTWTALLLGWVRQARPCSSKLPVAILGAASPACSCILAGWLCFRRDALAWTHLSARRS